MKISIVIINKNDIGLLDTLESLTKLYGHLMLDIVVIDSSNHKLDWIKKRFPNVNWSNFVAPIPNKISIPEQRNVSIKKAKGDILVFIDASCVPTNKNWLNNLVNPIIKENEQIVRGSLSNAANHITITEEVGDKVYVSEAPTINLAVSKEVFKKIGYFDESFSYGSDMDFTWRAIDNGIKIRFVEAAAVSHDFGNVKHTVKRYFYYGEARAKLYSKHTNRIGLMRNYEVKTLVYFFIFSFLPLIFVTKWYLLPILLLFAMPLPNNPISEITERYSFGAGLIKGSVDLILKTS